MRFSKGGDREMGRWQTMLLLAWRREVEISRGVADAKLDLRHTLLSKHQPCRELSSLVGRD